MRRVGKKESNLDIEEGRGGSKRKAVWRREGGRRASPWPLVGGGGRETMEADRYDTIGQNVLGLRKKWASHGPLFVGFFLESIQGPLGFSHETKLLGLCWIL